MSFISEESPIFVDLENIIFLFQKFIYFEKCPLLLTRLEKNHILTFLMKPNQLKVVSHFKSIH